MSRALAPNDWPRKATKVDWERFVVEAEGDEDRSLKEGVGGCLAEVNKVGSRSLALGMLLLTCLVLCRKRVMASRLFWNA
jgi:hypothetical protein